MRAKGEADDQQKNRFIMVYDNVFSTQDKVRLCNAILEEIDSPERVDAEYVDEMDDYWDNVFKNEC